ncbi:glycoside hydrolase family 127 protein [soil metagenome]
MKQLLSITILSCISFLAHSQDMKQKFEFINFSDVNITDHFWKPKIDKVATVTLDACIYHTEIKTPRIRNFIKVAKKTGEKHEGIYYDDSDVYKAIEAMGYALKTRPDTALERKADEWIDVIADAQLPDGYLNTFFTLTGLDKRWTDIEKHEDYCAGHLIEAAIAYYDATGKRKLLDVAIRFADHIDSVFRLADKPWFSGHQEIELALVKLYKVTGEDRYLKLADWYLQQRGQHNYDYSSTWITPEYWQENLPVYDQKEITGHAVRAMYLYTGAADVGALTGDEKYMTAMKNIWEDVVYRNMYVTGGIGSAGDNEGFSRDYDLPNESAYCETCASVGMVFWNQRMAQLSGDAKYIDVLEKSLYNAALDGLSLSGDHFFYDNPLASEGQHKRKEWFGTACCPSNISRLIASLGNYIYAKSANGIWVNLFVGSNTNMMIGNTPVALNTETGYPFTDKIKLNVNPRVNKKFALHLRLPGWFKGEASPGNLYYFKNYQYAKPTITVNGKQVEAKESQGYLVIDRVWKKDDVVEYTLPMQVQIVKANAKVKADDDKVALQRGPLIYCVEGVDNGGDVWNILVPDTTSFTIKNDVVLHEKIVAITMMVDEAVPSSSGTEIVFRKRKILAIPYYTWANRGASTMQVWLSTKIKNIRLNVTGQ